MSNNPLTTNPALITVRDNVLARADVILVEPFDPARSSGIPEPGRFAQRPPNVTKIPATIDLDQCGTIAVVKGSLKPGCRLSTIRCDAAT